MKYFRYVYDNKMLDEKDLVIIWDMYGIGDPPASIISKSNRERMENIVRGKIVFAFKDTDMDGMVKLGEWFTSNGISYKLLELNDVLVCWEDDTQVMFSISHDEWNQEQEIRNSF